MLLMSTVKPEIDDLRQQMKLIITEGRETQRQLTVRVDKIEDGTLDLKQSLKTVRDDNSRLMSSYYDLDMKYKELLHENNYIKNELNDLKNSLRSQSPSHRGGNYNSIMRNPHY